MDRTFVGDSQLARRSRPSAAGLLDDDADQDHGSADKLDWITAYHYKHHPFDVVGWDGYLWPFRFKSRTSSRSRVEFTSPRRSTRHSRRGISWSA